MPHGDATGAGINRRKFSGKELVTFRGFDAMDYHARWRGLSLPLFDTPDPLQHDYTPLSPYMYCGGDPVNRIDPSGCEILIADEFGTYTWKKHDNGWGFYKEEEPYNGKNSFVNAVSYALTVLMSKDNGRELITRIAEDVRKVTVTQFPGCCYDRENQKIGWDENIKPSVPVEHEKESSDIIIALGHEFGHLYSDWFCEDGYNPEDVVDREILYNNNDPKAHKLTKTEVHATHWENLLRSEHNKPLRTHYMKVDNSETSRLLKILDEKPRSSIYFDNSGKTRYKKLRKNRYVY